MKKLVISIFGTLLFALTSLASAYAFGLSGNLDYNKTVLFDVVDSLKNVNDPAIIDLSTTNSTYQSWDSYSNVYNNDLEYNSCLTRIGNDSISLVFDENISFDVHVSDFGLIKGYKSPTNNHSLLTVDKGSTDFLDNSIILSNSLAQSIGCVIGDSISFKGEKESNDIEFTVCATYSCWTTSINDFYFNSRENLCFMSRANFNKLTSSYSGHLIIKKTDNNYKNMYWNGINPLLVENDVRLKLKDSYLANDFTIKNKTIAEYQSEIEYLYSKSKSSASRIVLKVLLAIYFVFGLVAVSMFFLSVLEIAYKHKIIVSSLFLLSIVGIGIAIIKVTPFIVAHLSYSKVFYRSYVLSLQLMTGAAILVFLVSLIYALSKLHYKNFITEYTNACASREEIIKFANDEKEKVKREFKKAQIIPDNHKVLMFGSLVLPDGSAGATRLLNYGKILSQKGVDVYISALMKDCEPLSIYHYDKNIFFLPYANAPRTKEEKRHLYLSAKKEVINILNAFKDNPPKSIVIYSVFPLPAIKVIRSFCKKYNIRLVFDVVESHSITQQSLSSFFATYLPNKIQNNKIIKKNDKVICISSYLGDKFKEKQCDVRVVPFINDVKSISEIKMPDVELRNFNDKIYLLYVGNPAHKKDLIAPIIKAISDRNDKKIVLVIAGTTCEQLIQNERISKDELMSTVDNVVFLGKVPHSSVSELYRIADYSILLRNPNKESAKAGFPTKISESLAYGVPVITNLTSDLDRYLNETNSIIVPQNSIKNINDALDIAISMKDKLRKNSRKTAEKYLNISTYQEELYHFIMGDKKQALIISNKIRKIPGGAAETTVKPLQQRGYDVTWAANFSTAKFDLSEFPCKILETNSETNPFTFNNRKTRKTINEYLNNNDVDLIFCSTPIGGLHGRVCGKKHSIRKIIYEAHGFLFFKGGPKFGFLFKALEKKLAKSTDVLITINKEDYENAKKFKLRNNSKNVFMVNGSGEDYTEEHLTNKEREILKKEFGLANEFVFISIGELNNNKNVISSVKAFKLLHDKYPSTKLLICGEGKNKKQIEKYVNKNNLKDNVLLLGYRNDIKKLLKISNCYISSSLREGLSRTVGESMAAGLPCIVSNKRGLKDFVDDNLGGYLFNPRNYKDIADKMIKIYSSTEREKMSEYNRNKILSYSSSTVVSQMEEIFDKVL